MNEYEIEKLRYILNDEILLKCFRKLFDLRIEKERPDIGEANNELLGEKYRAYTMAKYVIQRAFDDLEDYRLREADKPAFHKER